MMRPLAAFAFTFALVVGQGAVVAAQEASGGERLFRQRCATCHALQPGQSKAGPHLDGIIGRRAGSVEGARYSRVLQDAQIIWDAPMLDRFLANPRQAVPGTTMVIGVPNADQRRSIIAYLNSLPAAAN